MRLGCLLAVLAGLSGVAAGAGAWLGSGLLVGLADQLDVEDELGLGRDGRLALAAVGELIGDEETTLAADVHAVEAGVPAGDDLVLAVGDADGLCAGMVEESNLVPSTR